MKRFLKGNWILGLILLLAAILRLYGLSKVPPSMHLDETALGYNAWSILKTGRDEYGNFLPLIFKSFGDYKPGLYVYLAVPFVGIFGLNEFAVRFSSAIIGIATVWLLYRFVLLFFNNEASPPVEGRGFSFEKGSRFAGKAAILASFIPAFGKAGYSEARNKPLALFSSFALAISPWHLQFSRGAWEANVALFFALGGIYCFLRAVEKRVKWLYLSALSFGAVVLAYQGGKMMVPLLILGLLICFWTRLRGLPKKHLFAAAFLLFAISLPILLSSISGGGGRLKVMSVFSYRRPMEEINQILSQDNGNRIYFNLFHSESLAFARGILGRYFNHFSGKFLFFEGDWSSARHSVPYAGVLYYLDFIFILAGVVYLIKLKVLGKNFVWYWLLVSPLPAALSRDAIQAVRSLNMVLPSVVIISCGIYQIYLWLKEKKKVFYVLCTMFFVLSYFWCVAYYLDQYYIHYPVKSSQFWQYGYKNVVNKIYPIRNNYSSIIFTQKWGQPYIYWLFYTKYPPQDYQRQVYLTPSPVGDVGKVERIDNIEFRNIYYPADRGLAKTLFVGTDEELPLKDIDPNQARILEEVKFLNGEVAFRIVETF
jgi:4-amino-4-deoxy-L-arabinose transferase-like glycosyltransferase